MDIGFVPSLIHFFGMVLLITSFGMIASPQVASCIRFFAIHSFILAVIAGLMAYSNHVEHLWIPAILTLIFKTLVIPHILFRIIRRLGIRKAVESYVNIPFSLLLAVLLVFLSFYVTGGGQIIKPVSTGEFLPLAVSNVFFGMLVMTTRKKAVTQVLGLLLMENGLFLMGITMTFGMPLLVEIGIFFDILVGVIIMGIFVYKIREAFEGIDVDDMTVLKG